MHYLIVSGLGGEAEYAEKFELQTQQLAEAARGSVAEADNVHVLSGEAATSEAIEQAWHWQGTTRVLVETCTDDHPHALVNYKARGFKLFAQETENRENADKFQLRSYLPTDEENVIKLWQRCVWTYHGMTHAKTSNEN